MTLIAWLIAAVFLFVQVAVVNAAALSLRLPTALPWRAVVAVALVTLATLAWGWCGVTFLPTAQVENHRNFTLMLFAVLSIAPATWIYSRVYSTTLWQTRVFARIQAVAFVLYFVVAAIIHFAISETFTVRNQDMAPTLVGYVRVVRCKECGKPPPFAGGPCERCGEDLAVTNAGIPESDRVIVDKLCEVRRGDIVLIRGKKVPGMLLRVAGLPGEKIELRDGFVFANGEKVVMPTNQNANPIQYTTQSDLGGGFRMRTDPWEPVWGSPERPAELDRREYFVLGDNSLVANDSRLWGGASFDMIQGVVTRIIRGNER